MSIDDEYGCGLADINVINISLPTSTKSKKPLVEKKGGGHESKRDLEKVDEVEIVVVGEEGDGMRKMKGMKMVVSEKKERDEEDIE
ncbi:hypothetical protein L6452_36252 [Arctium lappa]|uniref:Uncharacterized protein n=1 Tax=Arctium lappa TaxID=4217 RepID=A0ACB8Y9C8_ARCLA|nr:hypothetical protein L6452_36252 [Arctium lappa]